MTTEIWKTVEEFDKYEVSNLGNVKVIKTGKIMKQTKTKPGYRTVSLTKEPGRCLSRFCHRLVAIAFIPNPENKPEVDHIDRKRHNNNVSNLTWATRKEQAANRAYVSRDTKYMRSVWKCDKETGERIQLFESVALATMSIPHSSKNAKGQIRKASSGAIFSAFGYKWEYDDDEIIEGEQWKEISPVTIGFPPEDRLNYFISDKGRLRDPYRFIRYPYPDEDKYMMFSIRGKSYKAHRITALTFLDQPHGRDIVNQIDGGRSNCFLSNLEFVTQSENVIHAYETGLNTRVTSVCKYELSGKFIERYPSLITATREMKISRTSIQRSLATGTTVGGFQWKVYDNNLQDIPPVEDTRLKNCIIQYTREGEFVREYHNASEASKVLGVSSVSIIQSVNAQGRTSVNFQWRGKYSDVPVKNLNVTHPQKFTSVRQISSNGDVIMEFPSIRHASRKTDCSHTSIARWLRGGKDPRGFKWTRVEKDESKKRKRDD